MKMINMNQIGLKTGGASQNILHTIRGYFSGMSWFSFSALILIGDGQGRIGYGFAKANEVSDAIRKGTEAAKKNIIEFEFDGNTIPHEIQVDWHGARVLMKPAPEGTGVVAGSKVRAVLELGGVKNVVAKSLGSSNAMNQVGAAIKALMSLRNRSKTLSNRGLA